MATGDTHSDYLKWKKSALSSLICIDVLFKDTASTGQVMKIHTGCFLKYLLQGYWIEAFPILKALNNKDQSASARIGKEGSNAVTQLPLVS